MNKYRLTRTQHMVGENHQYALNKKGWFFWPILSITFIWARCIGEAEVQAKKFLTGLNESKEFKF